MLSLVISYLILIFALVLNIMSMAKARRAKAAKSASKARGGRTTSMSPSAPKAGFTGNGSRYGCGGKLKKV